MIPKRQVLTLVSDVDYCRLDTSVLLTSARTWSYDYRDRCEQWPAMAEKRFIDLREHGGPFAIVERKHTDLRECSLGFANAKVKWPDIGEHSLMACDRWEQSVLHQISAENADFGKVQFPEGVFGICLEPDHTNELCYPTKFDILESSCSQNFHMRLLRLNVDPTYKSHVLIKIHWGTRIEFEILGSQMKGCSRPNSKFWS